jgi:hypothetical protein
LEQLPKPRKNIQQPTVVRIVLHYAITVNIKAMNKKQSSPKEASKASKVLQNPKSSKVAKSLAGSVLSQASGKKK